MPEQLPEDSSSSSSSSSSDSEDEAAGDDEMPLPTMTQEATEESKEPSRKVMRVGTETTPKKVGRDEEQDLAGLAAYSKPELAYVMRDERNGRLHERAYEVCEIFSPPRVSRRLREGGG